MESRESLINQIALLHEEKEHQKIIALIEGQPPAAMDYELTSLLARAYINYAQPYMDSFQEHIKHAVELLRSVEAEGMADPQWYYRIGTALYWQDEEESAMTYLEQCLAMDPTHEDAPQVIEECKRAYAAQYRVGGGSREGEVVVPRLLTWAQLKRTLGEEDDG